VSKRNVGGVSLLSSYCEANCLFISSWCNFGSRRVFASNRTYPIGLIETIKVTTTHIVELDPDIKEHSSSDPNDALGAPSPEMTKLSEKGERDEKGRSRPLLYGKGVGKDHSTARYI
jgi:hypothetical protein